ncbi:EAL domain-containing protein [Vibrio sp. Y2-5]|uniref:EAL domain-containing protein n=1 Tax=Vibrio TaxID=662 RepID=UPI00142E4500|nr:MULTISPECIES: EAL domain-containing protein [Vibrio]MBD0788422.1 EAL domain-containing protein [Vibrio sp. Y2-5]NIY93511.1 EAL domain-containing protein [Vibrio diazotrophicus]
MKQKELANMTDKVLQRYLLWLPSILMVCAIGTSFINQQLFSNNLISSAIRSVEEQYIDMRKAEVVERVDTTIKMLDVIRQSNGLAEDDIIPTELFDKTMSSFQLLNEDNDGYIFVINKNKKFVVHRNSDNLFRDDIDDKVVHYIYQSAINGLSWVEYSDKAFNNRKDDIEAQKITHIRYVEDWDVVLGSGELLHDIKNYSESEAKAVTDLVLEQKSNQNLFHVLVFMIFACIIYYLKNITATKLYEYKLAIEEKLVQIEVKDKEIAFRSLYNDVTGLPNRKATSDYIDNLCLHDKGEEYQLQLIDIVDFQKVNNQYGFAVGDRILRQVTSALEDLKDETMFVGHIAADQFVVICLKSAGACIDFEKQAETFEKFDVCGEMISLRVRNAVVNFKNRNILGSIIVRNGELAMKYAKANNLFNVNYSPFMSKSSERHFKISNLLDLAIENKEFYVHYQPQVSTLNGKIIGVEALVRWDNVELGRVAPLDFIPIAEKKGIIGKISDLVLTQACKDIQSISPNGEDALTLSVNISPNQLMSKGFVENTIATIQSTGIDSSRIVFEITEGTFLNDIPGTVTVIEQLKEVGIKFSIDDFGTGYSSLSYLSKLPVDEVKIDKSFINDLVEDEDAYNLVKSILAVASIKQLTIVAEGVETKEQSQILADLACHLLQGYYFSRPVDVENLTKKIKDNLKLE